jgi:hypothetical protein
LFFNIFVLLNRADELLVTGFGDLATKLNDVKES